MIGGKKVILVVALASVALTATSLVGCAKKETFETIGNDVSANLSKITFVNYTTDVDLELTSQLYGEKLRMTYEGSIGTDRVIGTSEIHSFSDSNTLMFDDKYGEMVECYLIKEGDKYKQYASFDGVQYYWTGVERNSDDDSSGPLGVVPYIFGDSGVTEKNWSYINGKNNSDGYLLSSEVSGSYLKYAIDSANRTGLIDFNASLDEVVKAKVDLELDKDKMIKTMKIQFKDTGNLFPSILGGMDQDDIESKMEHFSVNISFDAINSATGVELPDAAKEAIETDNINQFSLQVTKSEKVDYETSNEVRVGNLETQLSSNWEEISSGAVAGSTSIGGKQTSIKKFNHSYSTSSITLTGGVALFDTTGANGLGLKAIVREDGKMYLDTKEYLNTKLASIKSNYDNAMVIDTDVPYIIGSKQDESGGRTYKIIVTDGYDEYTIDVVFDNSSLYEEYYDKSLDNMVNSFKILADTDKDENYTAVVEETQPEKPEVNESSESESSIVGSENNPYPFGSAAVIRIVDMATGNISNESISIKGILEDKIIVGQKIKEHNTKVGDNIPADGSIKLIQMAVSTDGYSYSEENKLNFKLNATLEHNGKSLGNETGGIPLGHKDMELTENTVENEFIMAFSVATINDYVMKITYTDPDLGDTEIFMSIK